MANLKISIGKLRDGRNGYLITRDGFLIEAKALPSKSNTEILKQAVQVASLYSTYGDKMVVELSSKVLYNVLSTKKQILQRPQLLDVLDSARGTLVVKYTPKPEIGRYQGEVTEVETVTIEEAFSF